MAKTVVINGVTYADTPEVNIPISGGGTAKFYETSDANITSADVLTGKTGYGASGQVSGGMANNGSTSGTRHYKNNVINCNGNRCGNDSIKDWDIRCLLVGVQVKHNGKLYFRHTIIY